MKPIVNSNNPETSSLQPLTRRKYLGAALACAGASLSPWSYAQNDKPIRILVGFPPGGGSDAMARMLADRLKDELGTPVVVENRPGAGGQVAAQYLKNSPADGRLFFFTHDHTISIVPQTIRQPGYDPEQDFVPVAGIATFVNVLAISNAVPARTWQEYLDWIKQDVAQRGNVGVPAPASVPEFLVKVLGQRTDLQLQPVPYKGAAPLIAEMLGNQLQSGIASVPDFIENHRAKRLRVFAVMGKTRQSTVPDAPTFAEVGLKGFESVPYYGFFAAAHTPQADINRFAQAVSKVLAQPDLRERLTDMGLNVRFTEAGQLKQTVQDYTQVWTRIIRDTGFAAQ